MSLAVINSNSYNLVLFLHLLSVTLGAGSAFFAEIVTLKYKRSKEDPSLIIHVLGTVTAPSLLLGGVFGGALGGMADDVYDFSQLWLTLAGVFWLTAVGASALLYKPPFITLPDADKYGSILSGVLHLSLAVMLFVMVWKPGF